MTSRLWLLLTITVFVTGCAYTGPPYFLTVCNVTSDTLRYEFFGTNMDPAERDSIPFYGLSSIEPLGHVSGRFLDFRPRGRQHPPFVPNFIDSLRFTGSSGRRLTLAPADLLAHSEWWLSPGYAFGIEEQAGTLFPVDCLERGASEPRP